VIASHGRVPSAQFGPRGFRLLRWPVIVFSVWPHWNFATSGYGLRRLSSMNSAPTASNTRWTSCHSHRRLLVT